MKNILTIALAVGLACQACYEDKGHYEYLPVNEISVVDFPSTLDASMGDTLVYMPKFSFADPGDTTGFDFWWEYKGLYDELGYHEVICHGRELRFAPRLIGSQRVQLCARETRVGVITTFSMYINGGSAYSKGWLVLREENNETKLSYIRPERSVKGDVTSRRVYSPYPDIREKLFPGEITGRGPLALRQILGSGSVGSAFYIIQQDETACFNGLSYKKEILLASEFLGGTPAGLDPRDHFQGGYASLILNADKTIYYRGANPSSFFVNTFANFPMKRQGEVVHVDRIIPAAAGISYFFALIDGENKRFLWVYTGNLVNGGSMLLAPPVALDGEHLDYNDISGVEILYSAFHDEGSSGSDRTARNITLYKRDGKTRVQRCKGTATLYTIMPDAYPLSDFENNAFPGEQYIDGNTEYYQLKTRAYLFFVTGSNLYWYDHLTRAVHLFYTLPAGAAVVKMASNPQESELGVALSNGKFIILGIENDQLATTAARLFEIDLPGRIVDMDYKFPNESSYTGRTATSNWD
ncbi:MAG: hypothetical protein LBF09_01270 [Odoribacteraceae bacterium]|jgi:hypothetical protein|nr:hypothetical protein [Odoribacteraceae bacterium]